MSHKRQSAQRGASLPFALIAVMLGSLLLVPILDYLSSRFLQVRAYEQVLGARYADDAATEFALWKLNTDAAFRAILLANRGEPITLVDVPEPVNGVSATVEVVLVNPLPWPWAMWADDLISIEGNNTTIYGGVHSNGTVSITGNNTEINGEVTQGYEEDPPVTWNIADFRPGGTEAVKASNAGMYHYHDGNWTVGQNDIIPAGLHFTYGNIVLNDNNTVYNNITLVAEGTITFNKNKETWTPYIEGLSVFSSSTSDQAIYIDGNKFVSGGGVCYAPNGTIELAGNKTDFTGAFVGNTIIVSKNNLEVDLPFYLTVPETCSIYDIRSTARDRQAVSRVRYCLDSPTPIIDAWAFQ